MDSPIRVVQIGLGPLGQMITPYLIERATLEIVGAVDIDPNIAGTDLGEICNGDPIGVSITDNLDEALENAQVAVVTTVSALAAISPLLERIIPKGVHVVSTCEELSYPWNTQPELSKKLDNLCQEYGVSILGTGINPGFLMDYLPTSATAICRNVDKILIERIQDASFRRLPFQQKIGARLTKEEFQARVEEGKIRHVGLTESMYMIAARLGWNLTRTEDHIEPVIADSDLSGEGWSVSAGRAIGVNQTGRAYIGDTEVLTLTFLAAVGQSDPRDRIQIYGTPGVDLVIPGGINGDVATCAIITNAIPVILNAQRGLRTMVDIPPISCTS